MLKNIEISGFSDEISSDFDVQLATVHKLGMRYISLRGIDGYNISQFSITNIKSNVLPKLKNSTSAYPPLDPQLVKFTLMMKTHLNLNYTA